MIGNVKHPAVLLVVLIGAMAAVPAFADVVLYNQVTPTTTTPDVRGSYNVGGLNINNGYIVTDQFELSQHSVLDSAMVALWVAGTGTVTSVDWAITTDPFGAPLASGTATNTAVVAVTDPVYAGSGNIYQETFSLGNLSLGTGTYWLQLGNAENSWFDERLGSQGWIAWDDSSAWPHWTTYPDATAYQFIGINMPSVPNTFQILGSADTSPSAVPEPSSVLLWATMLAGLGVVIRRKLLA